jgi:polyhydroxyalkanoate synthesis regulator phasin
MSFTETLRLVLDADLKGGVSEVENLGTTAKREGAKAEDSLNRVGSTMTTVGATMVAGGTAALFGLMKAGDAASDLGEVVSKSAEVFGSASGEVEDFADSAAKIGLSKRAALEAASGFGNLFDQLGLASGRSADMSVKLTGLASDLASFNNADITEVIEAQTAAFRGEYDGLQRFIPTLNAASVQQRAMADTGKDNAAALTEAEKAAATYTLMIDGAGKAAGDFERTSGSAANQQRQLSASFENMKATLGEGALPVMRTGLSVATGMTDAFGSLDDATGGVAGKIATFGTVAVIAIGALSTVAGQVIKARDSITGLGQKLSGLPASARLAAQGLAAVGVAAAGLEIFNQLRINKVADDLAKMGVGIDLTKLNGVREALKAYREELDELDDREGKGRMFSLAGANVFSTSGDADRQESIDQLRDKIADLEEQESSLVGAQKDLASSYVGSDEALTGLNESTTTAIISMSEYADQVRADLDPLFGMQKALIDNSDAQAAAVTAQGELNDAIAEFGPNSDEATAAQRRLEEANRSTALTGMDVESAMAELNAAVEANPALLDEAKAHLQTMRDQGLIPSQEVTAALGMELESTALKGIALGQINPEFNILTNAGEVGGQLEALRSRWDGAELNARINLAVLQKGGLNIGGGVKLFHEGGIVPGTRGQEVAAILQAGEEVLEFNDPKHSANIARTFSDAALNGGGGGLGLGGPIEIHVYFEHDKERLIRVLQLETANHGGNVQATFGRR